MKGLESVDKWLIFDGIEKGSQWRDSEREHGQTDTLGKLSLQEHSEWM